MPVGLDEDDYIPMGESAPRTNRKRNIIIFVVALGVVLAVLAIILGVTLGTKKKGGGGDNPIPPPPPPPVTTTLAEAMDSADLMNILTSLNEIAMKHDNSRAVDYGYNESAEWIRDQLRDTDYLVSFQPFTLSEYQTRNPATLASDIEGTNTNYVSGTDFLNMGNFNGMQTMTHNLTVAANLGCNAADFGAEVANTIVLVHRGDCTFSEKVMNAHAANALAVLIYNRGTGADGNGVFGGGFDGENPIPTFSLTFALGDSLRTLVGANTDVSITLSIDMERVERVTMNVIADTPEGDENNIVVTGSHLDSVPAGPGINDNGSGSACNLLMAKKLHALKNAGQLTVRNKVRFAWWAAEEEGLLGSTYYVQNLVNNAPQELAKIALNLNYDMLGSPNYYYAIYNGTGATDPNIRTASEKIQKLFEDFFVSIEQPFDLTPFDGRSDYGPFIANGIPAGGLFTGAEKIKSIAQRQNYGGLANAAYDPCYHQLCDDIYNINIAGYQTMTRAAATLVQLFAEAQNLHELLGDSPQKRAARTPAKMDFAYRGPKQMV